MPVYKARQAWEHSPFISIHAPYFCSKLSSGEGAPAFLPDFLFASKTPLITPAQVPFHCWNRYYLLLEASFTSAYHLRAMFCPHGMHRRSMQAGLFISIRTQRLLPVWHICGCGSPKLALSAFRDPHRCQIGMLYWSDRCRLEWKLLSVSFA